MKYIGKPIDLNKYSFDNKISKGVFEYRARKPENLDNRKNHNAVYLKRLIWSEDTHISEFLGYLLAKRSDFKVCDVELYKSLLSSGKFALGTISHKEKSQNDKLLFPQTMIKEFLETQNINRDIYNGVDIDTVMDAAFFLINKNKRPYQEFLDFKQDFVNMSVYDLKYMNPDRRIVNWFIREDMKNGQIDLYPMFDNEMILGFNEDLDEGELSEEELELKDSERNSAILIPKDVMQKKGESNYKDVMNYLLTKYPVQTQKALEQVNRVTSEELEEMLNSIEGVREDRVKRTIQLFNKREQELNKIYEKFKERVR